MIESFPDLIFRIRMTLTRTSLALFKDPLDLLCNVSYLRILPLPYLTQRDEEDVDEYMFRDHFNHVQCICKMCRSISGSLWIRTGLIM